MFRTTFTNHSALGTAVSVITDVFYAVYTGFTVIAEVSFSANAILTYITSATDFRICTVGTFFITIRTNRRTFRTAASANTGFYTFTAVIAFIAPAAIAYTVVAHAAAAAEKSRAVFTVFLTFANIRTLPTAVSAFTDVSCAVSASVTVVAPVFRTGTILTDSSTVRAHLVF